MKPLTPVTLAWTTGWFIFFFLVAFKFGIMPFAYIAYIVLCVGLFYLGWKLVDY